MQQWIPQALLLSKEIDEKTIISVRYNRRLYLIYYSAGGILSITSAKISKEGSEL